MVIPVCLWKADDTVVWHWLLSRGLVWKPSVFIYFKGESGEGNSKLGVLWRLQALCSSFLWLPRDREGKTLARHRRWLAPYTEWTLPYFFLPSFPPPPIHSLGPDQLSSGWEKNIGASLTALGTDLGPKQMVSARGGEGNSWYKNKITEREREREARAKIMPGM